MFHILQTYLEMEPVIVSDSICTCIHTYVYIYMYTYIHIQIHIYIYRYMLAWPKEVVNLPDFEGASEFEPPWLPVALPGRPLSDPPDQPQGPPDKAS